MRQYFCRALLFVLMLPVGLFAQESEGYSIGQRFHLETSFGDQGIKSDSPYWGDNVPPYKSYTGATKHPLPLEPVEGLAVEDAIRERRSVRSFVDAPIELTELARLLLSGNGVTERRGDVDHRATPSAGALYPIELYVVARRVTDLPSGLYHFQPQDSTLVLIEAADFSRDIRMVANGQEWISGAAATVFVTARFDRTTQKYADRGYRYVYMESGMVAENICLQAVSLGLGTTTVGAFNDDAANELAGIDGVFEATLLLIPVGRGAK
ncbi:MAG: SagB/ThcOx family dehydrogenase [candidate division Zixibacteria bacterium]|jgi:SagB-type dehydrogenase family enzyme|nr:SagB/ThcOx family dehydrogenase [candidate division Zixibacteria bacterium]